jgi:hypothetical protein
VINKLLLAAAMLAPILIAPAAHADIFDPTRPPASLFAVVQTPVSLAPGASIARTEMISGTDSITLPFIIPVGFTGGSVTVTLSDLGWPGLFNSLSFSATTSTSLLAQLAAPGGMTFDVTGAGMYFATVYGVADPGLGSGLYSLNLSYAPVPLPAAAWLLASGLVLLRVRRGKNSVTNAG